MHSLKLTILILRKRNNETRETVSVFFRYSVNRYNNKCSSEYPLARLYPERHFFIDSPKDLLQTHRNVWTRAKMKFIAISEKVINPSSFAMRREFGDHLAETAVDGPRRSSTLI